MKRFARLFAALDRTTRTNAKVAALAAYLAEAPEEDRLWAIALLSGRRPRRAVPSGVAITAAGSATQAPSAAMPAPAEASTAAKPARSGNGNVGRYAVTCRVLSAWGGYPQARRPAAAAGKACAGESYAGPAK